MALLDVAGLTMSFAEKKLYDDASFQLEKGEHMGVVGQNGDLGRRWLQLLSWQVTSFM